MADHELTSLLARMVPITMKKQIKQWAMRGSALSTLHLGVVLTFVWVGLTGLSYAVDQNEKAVAVTEPGSLRLVELFTSHGCSSCPAADRLLGELLENDESLLALEYHVDYWNTLVHGSDGNFVDPFSKPEYSMRQREYNVARLAGRPGVYTPQMIINGKTAVVGSNRKRVRKALNHSGDAFLDISVQGTAAKESPHSLVVSISGDSEQRAALEGTDIMLVRYLDSAVTHITGGENRNLKLENHHIVLTMARLGEVDTTGNLQFTIDKPQDGEGCVVMVQEGAMTPVYAAAECP